MAYDQTPYHYVHNNPINFIDPTGMSDEDIYGKGEYDNYGRDKYDGNGLYISPWERAGGVLANGYGQSSTGSGEWVEEYTHKDRWQYAYIKGDRSSGIWTHLEPTNIQSTRRFAWNANQGGMVFNNGGAEGGPDKPSLPDMKNNPPSVPGYTPPKSGARKVRNPNGRGTGWVDKNGRVWVPDDHDGTHAPHWDVQDPKGGGYTVTNTTINRKRDPLLLSHR